METLVTVEVSHPFSCSSCGKKFRSRKGKLGHQKTPSACKSGAPALRCPYCNVGFSTKDERDKHLHDDEKSACKILRDNQEFFCSEEFVCPHCGKKLRSKGALKYHSETSCRKLGTTLTGKRSAEHHSAQEAESRTNFERRQRPAGAIFGKDGKCLPDVKRKKQTVMSIIGETCPVIDMTNVFMHKRWLPQIVFFCQHDVIEGEGFMSKEAVLKLHINSGERKELTPGKSIFSSVSGHDMHYLNCGNTVLDMAWCPRSKPVSGLDPRPGDDSSIDYFAVATVPFSESFSPVRQSFFRSYIQIWKIDFQKGVGDRLEFLFCFPLDSGAPWSLSWCPYGVRSENTRMGLLAIACGDGTVKIFSIPSERHLKSTALRSVSAKGSSGPALATLRPSQTFHFGDEVIRCVQWNPANHSQILAAGSNGIATLITFMEKTEEFVVQSRYHSTFDFVFRGSGLYISCEINSISWCPDDRYFFAESGIDGGKLRIWDVRNERNPLCEVRWPSSSTNIKQINSIIWASKRTLIVGFSDGEATILKTDEILIAKSICPPLNATRASTGSEVTSLTASRAVVEENEFIWYGTASGQLEVSKSPHEFAFGEQKQDCKVALRIRSWKKSDVYISIPDKATTSTIPLKNEDSIVEVDSSDTYVITTIQCNRYSWKSSLLVGTSMGMVIVNTSSKT